MIVYDPSAMSRDARVMNMMKSQPQKWLVSGERFDQEAQYDSEECNWVPMRRRRLTEDRNPGPLDSDLASVHLRSIRGRIRSHLIYRRACMAYVPLGKLLAI